MPGDYYRMAPGDKVVIRAFFEKDMETRAGRRLDAGSIYFDKRKG